MAGWGGGGPRLTRGSSSVMGGPDTGGRAGPHWEDNPGPSVETSACWEPGGQGNCTLHCDTCTPLSQEEVTQ